MTSLSLVTNSQNNVDLVLEPKKVGDPVTQLSIQKLIDASSYTSLFINKSNINNAIIELHNVLKPLEAEQTGIKIRYQILERQDATIAIIIAPDEMTAIAEITTALGGENLSAKTILNSAQNYGVKKGFSKANIINLAQLASKGPAGRVVSSTVAFGKKAIKGENAKVINLVQSAQERILQPKDLGDGNVDMRELGDIICVNIGDPLAQKLSLTKGVEGYTVTGTILSNEAGEDITLNVGEGTSISPENKDLLISTIAGLPKMIDNGMEVDEVYKIKNVDVGSGNVDFDGSVIIEGDVCESMKVFATGDITVLGFVECATLKAGGDITITGGVIGKKQEIENSNATELKMTVNISAGGKIYAKYCQYSEITCNSDLRIENQLMHSVVNTGGGLWLGTKDKANGKLIGGYVKVVTSVHAGTVGATAGSNTFINFEAQILEFKKLHIDIDGRLKSETTIIQELREVTNKLNKLPKDIATLEMLNKVITTNQFHNDKIAEILEEKRRLEENSQKYMSSICVEATEKLYHGVVFTAGDFYERSRREYGPSRVIYKDRLIHIEPIVHN
ncbi:MAG: hypothetical protein ACI9C0_000598 [Alteromonadaceae bacterium]|jgi:uncharacterized protein (DUF342 family)|tara:strand:- start:7649 stop:9337 length:1689 start_codon:yes stop_codon:yes gene_type:complete